MINLHPKKWLYLLIGLHVFFWTLAPTLLRYTLPMDALEGTVWGNQLQLGYDRNPWLNAWLTHFAAWLGGTSGWLIYLFSQISVAICFWAVWKLGKKILHPIYALIGVLLLEGVQYYHLAAIDFNDNVLEIGLWALIALYFYDAIKQQKLRDWLLLGVWVGLATMAKYFIVMLLAPMLVLLLVDKQARRSFAQPGLYLAALVSCIIVAPHLWWLLQHNFSTINYALLRTSAVSDWHNSAWYFFIVQLAATVLPLLLFTPLLIGEKQANLAIPTNITSFDKCFLLFVGFGPFLLTTLLAAIFGITLHVLWGTPLLSLWGLALVAWSQPVITVQKFYRFVAAIFLVMAIFLVGYSCNILFAGHKSSANFPSRHVANYATQLWHNNYASKLKYVVGDRYLAGNVAFYSVDKPIVYIDADRRVSPWIDVTDLQKRGGIIIWSQKAQRKLPDKYQNLAPQIVKTVSKNFNWHRNKTASSIKLGFAIIPSLIF